MKLIFCPSCEDLLSLKTSTVRSCSCGASRGHVSAKGLIVIAGGAVAVAIPDLEFNNAFYNFVSERVTKEELQFTARVLSKSNPKVIKEDD